VPACRWACSQYAGGRHVGGRERTLTLCGSEPAVARLTQPKSVVTVADSLNMAAAV